MILTGKNLWQIAAGDKERKYDDIFLKYDVMTIGPGSPGPYTPLLYPNKRGIDESIRRFYQDAKKDDIVVCRLGNNEVIAIGQIADTTPNMIEEFGDIDGWDQQHVRRVRWFENTAHSFAKNTFGTLRDTFNMVKIPSIISWVTGVTVPPSQLTRTLKEIPPDSKTLTIDELGHYLFLEGLPSEYIEHLTTTLIEIERVAKWYANNEKKPKGRPSEHETVAYLTIPLLFALGWSHQTTAIEWKKIDIALFNKMPPDDSSLECVIEAKRLDLSVFRAYDQALGYALKAGRQNCKRLIVTDGIRYALYNRDMNNFILISYLNITRLRKDYPLIGCKGAIETIIGMAK